MSQRTEQICQYGGFYDGHVLVDGMKIWSVGDSPAAAIEAFCQARLGCGLESGLEELPGGESAYDWGYRFRSDNGTSFKTAGINVPGGVILTWWK